MRTTNIAEPVEPTRRLKVTLTQEKTGTWTVRSATTRITLADRLDYFEACALIREKRWAEVLS